MHICHISVFLHKFFNYYFLKVSVETQKPFYTHNKRSYLVLFWSSTLFLKFKWKRALLKLYGYTGYVHRYNSVKSPQHSHTKFTVLSMTYFRWVNLVLDPFISDFFSLVCLSILLSIFSCKSVFVPTLLPSF